MTLNYYIDKRRNRKQESAIRVSIILPWGERLLTTTGIKVYPENWDSKSQRARRMNCNSNLEDSGAINELLDEYRTNVLEIRRRFASSHNMQSLSQEEKSQFKIELLTKGLYKARRRIFPEQNIEDENEKGTLFTVYDKFTAEMGEINCWTDVTYKKYGTIKKMLAEYDKDLTFDDLDEQGLSKYISFLWNTKKLLNSTLEKHLNFLRTFLIWATKKGYNQQRAFENFHPKIKKPKKQQEPIFLSWEEVEMLYSFIFPANKQYLEEVRDVFCFTCATGLRHSDVYKLRKSDIFDDKIHIITEKTDDPLVIELNPYSKNIIQKYTNTWFPNDKALPVLCNQRMNMYLKKMAKFCGLNREVKRVRFYKNSILEDRCPLFDAISTHTGRRTFISYALARGIQSYIVRQWTGHSDDRAMKPYIGVMDKVRAEAMNLFSNQMSLGSPSKPDCHE